MRVGEPSNGLRRRRGAWVPVAAAVVPLFFLVSTSLAGPSHAGSGPAFHPGSVALGAPAASALATGPEAPLSLSVSVTPTAICAFGSTACAANTGVGRVTVSASATGGGTLAWPAVQIAFVIETTPYDGVYDPIAPGGESGHDPCASPSGSGRTACEESNGVPFFVGHAAQIASAIQLSNPHTAVSFALVDYFATRTAPWDDGDGAAYHVDVSQFVTASDFGAAVGQTFQRNVLGGGFTYAESDFADNFLDSSSITALYGALTGSGLGWSPGAHHVVVWMGSTAPRDPAYLENYCVSAHVFAQQFSGPGCYSTTCEPSYEFPTGASPRCEGWVSPQDGVPSHSIAALAHAAPACMESFGGVCTIDTIDLPSTPTDAFSPAWNPLGEGGPPAIQRDVAHVLQAGCDLAMATGGTWTGPVGYSCPGEGAGTLPYVSHGPYDRPNLDNPALMSALSRIGFGPVQLIQSAAGGNRPMFSFVPFGAIRIAPDPQVAVSCLHSGVPESTCQVRPTVGLVNGIAYLEWNFSAVPRDNVMFLGDTWSASFNVVAIGPPYQSVPIDACTSPVCLAAGSAPIAGVSSVAAFVPSSNLTLMTESFPVALLTVLMDPSPSTPPSPPGTVPSGAPPAPIPSGILPIPVAHPALPSPGTTTNPVSVANVSLQSLAVGFLAAGFGRVAARRQRVPMKLAHANPRGVTRFTSDPAETDDRFGRFD